MKLKTWILSATTLVVLGSCNNAGEGDEKKDTSSTTMTTTTDNNTSTTTGQVVVPDVTRTSFTSKYPTATNVNWRRYDPSVVTVDWDWAGWGSMDTSDYYVSFNDNGADYWAWYDENGNWVGTVNTVTDHSSLPAGVNSMLKSQYSGYTVVSVDRENDKNRTAYEIELDKGGEKMILLVDENGKVLKTKGAAGKTKSETK
jgi:hypothetical protein